MAALARQHEAAQRQAANGFHAQLAAVEAQHAQQLQQAKEEIQSQVLDTEERLQDVKDLLVALQARFNNRWSLHFVYPTQRLSSSRLCVPGLLCPIKSLILATSALSRRLFAQHDFRMYVEALYWRVSGLQCDAHETSMCAGSPGHRIWRLSEP